MRRISRGLAVALLFLAAPQTDAAPGDLDTSFGTGGKVVTDVAGGYDSLTALVAQTDGKLVAGGLAYTPGPSDFALVRYLTNGSLDSTFGTSGKVLTDFGGYDQVGGLAIQVDGKIVAAGSTYDGTNTHLALARYNADGTLDSTFGTAGKVTTVLSSSDFAAALVLQGGGTLVGGGSAVSGGGDFLLVRYNADGTLDGTFGSGGVVTTDFGDGTRSDLIQALALQGDGKIVAGGAANDANNFEDVAIARYNTDGTLDSTFGTAGKVVLSTPAVQDFITGLAIQADGRIVASVWDGGGDFVVLRFNANGSLDTTFGMGGKVVTDFGSSTDRPRAVILQPDGRIVVAGAKDEFDSAEEFALARYLANGSLDTSFGSGGTVTTSFGGATYGGASALLRQSSDGKLVAAGGLFDGGAGRDFALARYLAATTTTTTTTSSSTTTTTVPFCQGRPNGTACDDGNPCTSPDKCTNGVCKGKVLPNGTACDDGNACTQTDKCQSGICVGTCQVGATCGGGCNAKHCALNGSVCSCK